MAKRNYYLTVPSTTSGAAEDDPSGEDAEFLGFVVVDHYYCSEAAMETGSYKLFKPTSYNFEREALFQRKNNTEPEVTFRRNEQTERERLCVLKEKVEQETLKSLGRSLRLLQESEEVASSTAQELLRQREQLERTERRLDEVHGKLTESKKVIRNLQGVLGNVKHYVAKKCRSRTPSPNKRSDAGNGSPRPKSSIVSINTSARKEGSCCGNPAKNIEGVKIRDLRPDSWNVARRTRRASSVDEMVEKRLSDISSSIHRLQNLALDLNAELHSENELINRIIVKADGASTKVVAQTKEVTKLKKELKWF